MSPLFVTGWFPRSRSARRPVDDRIWLGPRREGNPARRAVRAAIGRAVGSRVGLAIVRSAMRDARVRAELLLSLSDRVARTASWDAALHSPSFRAPAASFEDLTWLFSSNWLNHRFTRLDLDEAAYFFRLIRSTAEPRFAELGRFRGGSTVFFAAAGAQVTSVDGHPKQDVWGPEVARVLGCLGLRERVDLVVGDTRTQRPELESYDIVFFDASVSYDGVIAEFRTWWPALKPGGHAIFRDGRAQLPHLLQVQRAVETLAGSPLVRRLPDRDVPGCLVHFIKEAEAA